MWFDRFDWALWNFVFQKILFVKIGWKDCLLLITWRHELLILTKLCDIYVSNAKQSGGPTVAFMNGKLPAHGFASSKLDNKQHWYQEAIYFARFCHYTSNFIPLPKQMRGWNIRLEMVRFMNQVQGKLGFEKEQFFPCTFELNDKGGMDGQVLENICLVAVIEWKCMLIKIDSGSGCNNN